MKVVRRAVAVAVAGGLLAIAVVFLLPLLDEGEDPAETVLAWSGYADASQAEAVPLALAPPEERTVVQRGMYDRRPVLVFIAPARILEGVEAFHGEGVATPSVTYPGNPAHRVFAISAISTHHGCGVRYLEQLGASKDIDDYDGDGIRDGRLIDVCHQGQWDAYARGARVPGTRPPRPAVAGDPDRPRGRRPPCSGVRVRWVCPVGAVTERHPATLKPRSPVAAADEGRVLR